MTGAETGAKVVCLRGAVKTQTAFATLQVSFVVESPSLHSLLLLQFIAGYMDATKDRLVLNCLALSMELSPIGCPL